MEDDNLDYEKNNMDNSNENDDEDDKLVLVEVDDNINGDQQSDCSDREAKSLDTMSELIHAKTENETAQIMTFANDFKRALQNAWTNIKQQQNSDR